MQNENETDIKYKLYTIIVYNTGINYFGFEERLSVEKCKSWF